MENKLRNLYALQLVDSHLDELEDLKGDLPSEVRALEEQLAELKERLRTLQENVRSTYMQRDTADGDIITLKEKLEKYKKQQYQVRNNKEYDALTREMDAATEAIQTLEKEMESLEAKAEIGKGDVEATQQLIAEATVQLDERRTALAFRWILAYATERSEHSMSEKLAGEIIAAYKKEGGAMKKRDDTHKMAEANKAFAHYRW